MCQLPWRSRWVGWFASSLDTCSNLASVSSLCYLIMLLSLFPSSVILSNFSRFFNFFHLIKLFSPSIYLLFTLSTHSTINVPAVDTTENNSLSRRIECTRGIFGHREVLMWGDRGMTGGFSPRTKWNSSHFYFRRMGRLTQLALLTPWRLSHEGFCRIPIGWHVFQLGPSHPQPVSWRFLSLGIFIVNAILCCR